MGQKVHPKGFRLGVIEQWDSKWFARREYAQLLHEDLRLRKFLKQRLYHAGISKVEIERAANKAKINIYTARPGIVIGKKGAEIEKLKTELGRLAKRESFINIHEVRRPDVDAQLVAENVALQLERRVAFRRAMKEAVGRAMRMGALGVKVRCSGRLGGADGGGTSFFDSCAGGLSTDLLSCALSAKEAAPSAAPARKSRRVDISPPEDGAG